MGLLDGERADNSSGRLSFLEVIRRKLSHDFLFILGFIMVGFGYDYTRYCNSGAREFPKWLWPLLD